MSEFIPILETLVADADAGRKTALCIVLRTKGSTPQSAGAAMLVRSDMSTVGTLGGGCVEGEVRTKAFGFLDRRDGAMLDFLLDHEDGFDDGLICGGRMFIGVQPIASDATPPFRNALAAARAHKPASIPFELREGDAIARYRVHIEPPPTLLIVGAGHVGQAVARLARELDFRVVVIDDRADYASRERFGERVELIVDDISTALRAYPIDGACYVVIVTRGHKHDHTALDAVIRSDATYVGLIGSKRKSRLILDDLSKAGVTDEQIAAVHTPIGLAIGAVTVPEIAVSILAELIAHRRARFAKIVEGPLSVGESMEVTSDISA